MSYEFLGRAAHLYSRNKITLLHSALDHFIDCSASLPGTISLPRLPLTHVSPVPSPCASPSRTSYLTEPSSPEERLLGFDARDYKSPGRNCLIHTITNMIDSTLSSAVEDPFVSESDTQRQTPFFHSLSSLSTDTVRPVTTKHPLVLSPIQPLATTTDPMKRDPLMPSPLKIRKTSDDHTGDGTPRIENDSRNKASARPRPPPLPLKIVPASQLNIRNHKSRATTSSSKATVVNAPRAIIPSRMASNENDSTADHEETAEGIDPARAARIVRFNRGINLLREQIKSNITEIQQHVDHVEEIQRTRRSRKMQRAVSFWSFSPIKNEEVEEQQAQEPVMDQFGNILIRETKQQRIARLRTEGWNTVGLRSPRSTWKGARYYQKFCNLVLTELCLDSSA